MSESECRDLSEFITINQAFNYARLPVIVRLSIFVLSRSACDHNSDEAGSLNYTVFISYGIGK